MISVSGIERKHPTFYDANSTTFASSFGSNCNSKGFGGSISLSISTNQSPYIGDGFLEIEPTSPTTLEDTFCKNFNCCGLQLNDMHDLLKHSEECHHHTGTDAEMMGADEDLLFPFDVTNLHHEIELDLDDLQYTQNMHSNIHNINHPNFLFNCVKGSGNSSSHYPKTLSLQDIYCDSMPSPVMQKGTPAVSSRNHHFSGSFKGQQAWFSTSKSIESRNRSQSSTIRLNRDDNSFNMKSSAASESIASTQEPPQPPALFASLPTQRPRIGGERHCNTCRSKKTSKWYKDHVHIGKYICKTCYNQIYKERLRS